MIPSNAEEVERLSHLPARLDPKLLCPVAQGELGEFPLEVIVTPDYTVLCHHQELLILRPTEPLDGAVLPGNGFDEFPGAAVEVYARFGGPARTEGQYLGLIAI